MAVKNGISKSEYAVMYDEHALRLYYFALRLTGDELLSRRALAELFAEGYHFCSEESFLSDMVTLLWRILGDELLKSGHSEGAAASPLGNIPFLSRAAVLLRIVFSLAEAEIAGVLDISHEELRDIYSSVRADTAAAV